MSQRLFYFLALLVGVVAVAGLAFLQGHQLVITGETLNEQLLSVIAPLAILAVMVNNFFDVIDARVASGQLKAGDIAGLFTLNEFYVTTVAVIAGLLQAFGFTALAPDTQMAIVNLALIFATLVMRSFVNRAPTDPIPTAVRIEARAAATLQSAQNAKSASVPSVYK